MIIDCIADLHGFYPELEGGDLLIVAGDLTARDTIDGYIKWKDWIIQEGEKYCKIVIIAGNHDSMIQQKPDGFDLYFCKENQSKWVYLEDSGTEFEYEEPSCKEWGSREGPLGIVPYEKKKLKIWGSPWTKTFEGINPHCKAFTVDTEEELAVKFSLIPSDVDILITHSPPWGILDKIKRDYALPITSLPHYLYEHSLHGGSKSLADKIGHMEILPKLWVWGHIHEAYGQETFKDSTICVNASHVNERYEPVNKPIRIIL